MLGLGFGEVIVIVVVALLVLGPRRLPELARQFGRAMREVRRAAHELQVNLDEATRAVDVRPPPQPPEPLVLPGSGKPPMRQAADVRASETRAADTDSSASATKETP
mgnify:CR=1 FL=1